MNHDDARFWVDIYCPPVPAPAADTDPLPHAQPQSPKIEYGSDDDDEDKEWGYDSYGKQVKKTPVAVAAPPPMRKITRALTDSEVPTLGVAADGVTPVMRQWRVLREESVGDMSLVDFLADLKGVAWGNDGEGVTLLLEMREDDLSLWPREPILQQ